MGTQASGKREMQVTARDREHWAFRELAATGEARDLLNAGEPGSVPKQAERRTLIRRAYFGLIGLPPTPAEVDLFLRDASPAAYERLVDRLLESKHYGERWGRHWLDLARYADSDGYESDKDRPEAWPYRDWVIRALNADLPYDRFVKWQIAGDEYEPANREAIAATGFLVAGPIADTTPADTEENKLKIRYDELDDMLSTTASAMLALTVGCARCHDHKFDPIPTRDYYRLLTAFQGTERAVAHFSKPHREREQWVRLRHGEFREFKMKELGLSEDEKFWLRQPEHFFVPIQKELYQKHGSKLKSSDEELRTWLNAEQQDIWKKLDEAVSRAETTPNHQADRALMAVEFSSEAPAGYLLGRGDVMDRRTPVEFGLLQVLQRGRDPTHYLGTVKPKGREEIGADGFVAPRSSQQRKALAEWLTDAEHGAGHLLARVMVNRVWQHHFGEGLVKTANDFGTQGSEPSDARLLDALAREFIRNGWRLKPLHKLILMSQAYRAETPNQFRNGPVRLEAEVLRDSILAVSGRLNRKMFGPPFRPIIPKEAIATRSKDEYPADLKDGIERWRRSIYAFTKRSVSNPFMEVFDSPDSTASCGRRNRTTVPTQALTLLNDQFVRESAIQLAQKVLVEAGEEPEAQVKLAYQLTLARAPTETELAKGIGFIKSGGDAAGAGIATEGLTDFCHLLFTLNEFIYVN